MQVVKYILVAIYAVVCLVLITLTMIQSKDDAGASSTITGGNSNNFFEKNKGKTKEGKLKRWTIILAAGFVLLTMILNILSAI